MIQSYKQHPKLQETYDIIIIGSGMGGLATAAILSKEGQKVLVLERHYTAGGLHMCLSGKIMNGMWEFII